MSFQAMTWAVSQKCGSAASKMVLMMLANHANGHTGQCNPRHKMLAEECEMRVETLKEHLKKLAAIGLIEIIPQYAEGIQLPNHYRLNMRVGGGENHPGGGGENHPPYNQEFNQESKHTPIAPKGADVRFAKLWDAYPKKIGKDAARRAFDKRKVDDVLLNTMLDAIARQKKSVDWLKDAGQYIPHPATWLNQGRWQDEEGSTDESAAYDWRQNPRFAGCI